ncbi:MAG: hypothetical protein AAB634_03025 [Patescibacteria group bacterium]
MANPFQQNPIGGAQFAPSSFQAAGLPWRLLMFSGFLFGFAIFVFLGLKFGYGTYLQARSSGVDEEIAALASQVGASEQQRLVSFYSQLVNVETVLGRHSFSYNIFPFLESVTIPNAYFVSASFSRDGFSLGLQGRARSIQDVVDQLAVFDGAPQITSATLNNVSFDGAETAFGVSLVMKKDFFEKLF